MSKSTTIQRGSCSVGGGGANEYAILLGMLAYGVRVNIASRKAQKARNCALAVRIHCHYPLLKVCPITIVYYLSVTATRPKAEFLHRPAPQWESHRLRALRVFFSHG